MAGEVLSSSPGPTASLIAKEEIRLNRRIGEGAHGSVHEGTWSNVHGAVRGGGGGGGGWWRANPVATTLYSVTFSMGIIGHNFCVYHRFTLNHHSP